MEGLRGNVKICNKLCIVFSAFCAYFHINDDAKKCRYLSVTNNFIFSHKSFKLLSYEVLQEVCFAMDTLIKVFISLISVNFMNLIKQSNVYCR